MAYLEIDNLAVEYEKRVRTLDQFYLSIERGQLVSLLGPSGCGKTTTLRSIAGFIEPSYGRIVIDGRDVTRLAPNKRDIGLVFQSYALFPHLTAFQNVAFGLQMRRVSREESRRRAMEALRLVDLESFAERRPAQLSGGQRQRVALARAIVIEPKLLLLDEPLSNLDAKLRVSMRTEIRRLQRRLGITTVYVTHDQMEALAISDRVVVMNRGKIEQDGAPEAIYAHPDTPFVADFLGLSNRLAGTVREITHDGLGVAVGERIIHAPRLKQTEQLPLNTPVMIYFRPEAASLSPEAVEGSLPGDVLLVTFQGSSVQYLVRTDFGELLVNMDYQAPRFPVGAAHVVLKPEQLVVLEDRT